LQEKREKFDTYVIPPNFIESGTFLGGMFKVRNTIEAGVLALLVGVPIFCIEVSLTARIVILCMTALPLALLALIGVSGESLSSFLLIFAKYLKNRRVITLIESADGEAAPPAAPKWTRFTEAARHKAAGMLKKALPAEYSAANKWLKKRRAKAQTKRIVAPKGIFFREKSKKPVVPTRFLNPAAEYLPIEKIENGIIHTKDRRYIKIVEIIPVNFLLRSAREQKSIIYSFIGYLKISPAKIQIKVLTRRADINRHLETVRRELDAETDDRCRLLQEDYIKLIRQIGSKEAVTRRFFIIFEYEPWNGSRRTDESEMLASLNTAAHTAANYLRQCGNEVIIPENENAFHADVLYNLLNRTESVQKPLAQRINETIGQYAAKRGAESTNGIPACEFFAPGKIDFMHGRHIEMDGVYHAYLLIPSSGFKEEVPAGWLSLLVNAGDGIDIDLFLTRQPKERIILKLGRQLRINRSKIKDASDTNTDFDDLDGAIKSGYFLKEGISNNEDFYYINLLITVTAESVTELEWRTNEMKKLLISQDMNVCSCAFREEQAFLSALPLASLEKKLFERSKRNVLTGGASSCYPFTSYEMCDDGGILLGVNKHNNSLIIVDIFNSAIYKNANMAVLGCSGAGKTFTLQLMALRMRRKGIQVFIIAPLKGHEFHRACSNIGGEFIQISPASQNCINVMEIRRSDKTADELLDGVSLDKSELSAKIQRLHIFFSLLIPDMSHEEKQLLDDALIRTYAAHGITHGNDSLEDSDHPGRYRRMPVLGDLYDILFGNAETKRLANILNRLVHGSASTFSQQTNVNLDNKYTVLDISELTGDLLTVGMFVALDFVWDKAKENRTVEKSIYLDEAWQLIGASSNRLAADFVLSIFKIIRGYGGSAVCATQDLNDFFSLDDGRYGKGIINNAKTKIILNLEDEEAQRVQGILRLSEAEVMEITHFERGNGLISTNNNNINDYSIRA
jgi:type IV secretory pathway VirB4 component